MSDNDSDASPSPGSAEPFNPYQSPTEPVTVSTRLPTGVILVAVLAILFATTGLINGCCGVVGQFMPELIAWFQQEMQSAANPNQGMAKLQADFQADMLAITARFRWFIVPVTIVGLILNGMILPAAVGLIKRRDASRRMLIGLAWGSLVYSLIAKFVVGAVMQLQMFPLQMNYFKEVSRQSQGPNDQVQMVETIGNVSLIGGLVLGFGIVAIELILYLVAIWYLRRNDVTPFFGPGSTDMADAPPMA